MENPKINSERASYAPGDAAPVRSPDFWEERYKNSDTGWDLAAPAPPFVEYFSRPDAPKPPLRALVPGCGRGHDALFLANLGFNVVAVDFARQALDALRRRRRNAWIPAERCRTLRCDVLHLPARFAGSFDLLVEETCFCAIDPALRDGYVAMAKQVLVPGGKIVALLYPFREGMTGPPFPMSEAEIRERFSPAFEIELLETPATSVARRKGEERLIIMKRR